MSNNPALACSGLYESEPPMPTQTMTALDVLIAARAKIDTPEKWTKGAYERDGRGKSCSDTNEAAQWCADGALLAVTTVPELTDDSRGAFIAARKLLRRSIPVGDGGFEITYWNDHPDRKHADVVGLYDRAIALARQEQEGAAQ